MKNIKNAKELLMSYGIEKYREYIREINYCRDYVNNKHHNIKNPTYSDIQKFNHCCNYLVKWLDLWVND